MDQVKGKELHHHHHHHSESDKNIGYAFFLNFSFTIIELIGGLFTNSMAILSDAIHDLGDSISLGLAWYLQKVAKKGSDKKYSYGYKRFSLLGAIINSVVLTAGSVLILVETIPRIFHPQTPDATGMFWLAILGIIVNGAAVFRLNKGKSINERVVSLHLLEDVLGWAAILIGSIIMYFFDAPVIDPLLSVLISIYILINVFRNLKISFRIILQGTPYDVDINKIKENIRSIEGIDDIHDFHIWSIDGSYHIVTVHAVVKTAMDMKALSLLKEKIRSKLEAMEIHHVTIEFETKNEECTLECCSN